MEQAARRSTWVSIVLAAFFLLSAAATPTAQAGLPPTSQTSEGRNGRVAYLNNDYDELWTVRAGGGGALLVASKPGPQIDQVRWSPGGSRLAFITGDGRKSKAWIVRARGGPVRELSSPGGNITAFSWLTDDRVVVQTFERGAGTAIWTLDRSGLNPELIVPWGSGGGAFGAPPTPSPAGDRIMYHDAGNFLLIDVDGTDPVTLDRPQYADNPAWSPDGSRILFTEMRSSLPDDGSDLWAMDADGTNPVRLTSDPNFDDQATWSPDGQRIVFTHCGDPTCAGDNLNVLVMDADGSDVVQVSAAAAFDSLFPVWSPDSQRVVFTADSSLTTTLADGSGLKALGSGTEPTWLSLP